MATRTYAIAVTWQMPSPVRVTTRNLAFSRADDVIFGFTVYADDDAETLLDVSTAIATLTMWEEGGPTVLTATSEVTDGPAGEMSITLTGSLTAGLIGRYRYNVAFADDSTAVLVEGVIQVSSLDALATQSDAIRNGDNVIYGPLIVGVIQPPRDTNTVEISRDGWGSVFTAELTDDTVPTNANPLVGTIGNRLDVTNRLRARFISTPGPTYALDKNGITGPSVSPVVISSNTNLSGSAGPGVNAPYQLAMAGDTVDARTANLSVALQTLSHNFGGTGTYGARSTQRLLLTTTGAFNDTTTNQQHTVQEAWFTASHNVGGTGPGQSAAGFAYVHNPQVYLNDGATHWYLANGLGEVNLAVRATRRTITLGGTVTAGDVLTVTFSGADVTGTPVAVTYTTGASQSLTMVGNGLEAAINDNDSLRASNISAIGRSGVVTIHYPYGATVSVAVSTSGGATTTMTLGDATGGASASVKLGMSLIRLAADAAPAAMAGTSAFIMMGAQSGTPQSGGMDFGINFGGVGDYTGGQWPMRHDATLIGASFQQNIGGTARSARMTPNRAANGIDFRNVLFSESTLSGPGGFAVVGSTIYLGGAIIEATENGLVIDVTGKVATGVAIASGGGGGSGVATNNYFKGDVVRDSGGGMHVVATVNPATGAVTSLTTLHMPSCRGTAPSNPLTTTGGSGSGLTINATWPAAGNAVSINPSGGDIDLGGTTTFTEGSDRETSISSAGTNQAGATALTKSINVVTTVTAGQGVRLGDKDMVIFNQGANDLNVYPEVGSEIDDLGTNIAAVLAPDTSCEFIRLSSTQVYSR